MFWKSKEQRYKEKKERMEKLLIAAQERKQEVDREKKARLEYEAARNKVKEVQKYNSSEGTFAKISRGYKAVKAKTSPAIRKFESKIKDKKFRGRAGNFFDKVGSASLEMTNQNTKKKDNIFDPMAGLPKRNKKKNEFSIW